MEDKNARLESRQSRPDHEGAGLSSGRDRDRLGRGAATGAGVGAVVAGPIGAVIGGAIGAVVGGAAGHAAGEAVNPTVEREFWSKNFQTRPYYKSGKEYSEYEPAYRFGWESAARKDYAGKKFDEVEPELLRDWNGSADGATDPWTDARDATHDAWLRVRGN